MDGESTLTTSYTETKDSSKDQPHLLVAFFDRIVSRYPEVCALDVPPGEGHEERVTYSYAEMQRLAHGYSVRLEPLSGGECIVALVAPRTNPHLWAAQLGANRLGAAYLCIDPVMPDEVIRRTLSDADPVAIVVDPSLVDRIAALSDAPRILTDSVHPSEEPPEVDEVEPTRLAYLIYTSGTTGTPKGVMIENRSVCNLVASDIDLFKIGPGDRVTQNSSAAYDSSIEEVWTAWAVGATLVVVDDQTIRMGPDLASFLAREHITVLSPPPTLLRSLGCENPQEELPELSIVYVGGEALTPDVADKWAPGRRLINGYGPTECTITCVRCDVELGKPISIGWPVPNATTCIVDENLNPVPDGQAGELCMGGIGIARGYRNRPDVTASKFIDHKLFGCIYRTGDLAQREPDGSITYLGRIDAQVKLRGFRIELEAIEAVIATFPGVTEAACKVQAENGREWISAHVVSSDPISFTDLRDYVGSQLPWYMVPSAFALIDALPKSLGSKIRRNALPFVASQNDLPMGEIVPAETDQEKAVAKACAEVLGLDGPLSVVADFFRELGGSSLLAAQVVTKLRANPETAAITVRDIYDRRTIREIAHCAVPISNATVAPTTRPEIKPIPGNLVQLAWIIAELLIGSVIMGALALWCSPLLDQLESLTVAILVLPPLLAVIFMIYAPLSVLIAVGAKKLLIGQYTEGASPAWGSFYVRNWLMRQVVRAIPWRQLEGTEFACMALRALGAKIGQRVHFHHGALPTSGGWDLLDIGDDVTVCHDAILRVVDLQDQQIVSGPIRIENGVTVGVRALVGPKTIMRKNSSLEALSSLVSGSVVGEGERWSGIRAAKVGTTDDPPECHMPQMSPVGYATMMVVFKALVGLLQALPFQVGLIAAYNYSGKDTFLSPLSAIGICLAAGMVTTPLMLAMEALICRAMGRVEPGVIAQRTPAYARVWLKGVLVDSSCRILSGTLFWPIWLRAAGMKVAKDCEISTIIDVVPELVSIGPHVFFADGIYLGMPVTHRGTVKLARLSLSERTFVGNHAVIPCDQDLPKDILIGVSTVAHVDYITEGTSWFGVPPMELPRREIVSVDESLTFKPTTIRYINRVLWELLRFTVPSVPLYATILWFDALEPATHRLGLVLGSALDSAAISIGLCLFVLALKWLLLGRVKEGVHPLWSCWCSRWDFLYVAWGEWSMPILSGFEGTLMLNPYLRAMGMKIGKRVLLGTGFSHVVDPDMLIIGDDATVSAAYQAHTFEDRVLKIGKVIVERGATLGRATVPLYGAHVGENCQVAPNSVIMKHERLLPGLRYEGAPTRVTREIVR